MLVALLLAVGTGAGLQLTFLLEQSRQLGDDQRRLLTQVARFDALLAELSAAQSAYVAPGQPDAPWFDRVSTLTNRLTTELAAVRNRLTSPDSATSTQSVADALSKLAVADSSARDFLTQEQELLAADVVFGEARDAINTARSSTSGLVTSEGAAFEVDAVWRGFKD